MALVTEANWYDFVNWTGPQQVVAFDTETTGLRPFHGDRLVGISIGADDTHWYLPFRHEQGPNLHDGMLQWVVEWLNNIVVRDPAVSLKQIVGHNTKFDLHMLIRDGMLLPPNYPRDRDCPVLDTMLGAHLANENEKNYAIKGSGYGLKYLADKYGIGRGSKDEEDLREIILDSFGGEMRQARKDGAELRGSMDGMWKGFMWKLPSAKVAPYAMADTQLTWGLLTEYVYPFLMVEGLAGLFHQVCNYNLLITELEETGVAVDPDLLDRITEEIIEKTDAAENTLWMETGISNCKSPPQCNKFFGLASTKEMDLKYAVMEGRADGNAAELLLKARGFRQVRDTYLIPYQKYLAPDGAIHPSFKIHGTATGRLSCTDPNLMALPRDVRDQPAKAVFVARPGYVLAEIDLSQAELRVASQFAAQVAEFAADPTEYLVAPGLTKMGSILADPSTDLHTETMYEMQKYRPDTDRSTAKRANLSAIFGIGARKYSLHYAIPLRESESILGAWRKVYPEFGLLYNMANNIASSQRYITLPMSGRVRRYTYEGDNYPSKASSNWVQGTVADIMRIAMHDAHAYLVSIGGRLLLQVHDSLIMEIPAYGEEFVAKVLLTVKTLMTDFPFNPPLMAEAKVGMTWGDMKVKETRHDELGAKV